MRKLIALTCLLAGISCGAWALAAEAATSISTATTITSPGEYILASNITGDINIYADHVDLDCNDKTISGTLFCKYANGSESTDITIYDCAEVALLKVWNCFDVSITNCVLKKVDISGANTANRKSQNVWLYDCTIAPDDDLAASVVTFGTGSAAAVACGMSGCDMAATGVGTGAVTGGYGIQVSAPTSGSNTRSSVSIIDTSIDLTGPTKNYVQIQYADMLIDGCTLTVTDPVGSGDRVSLRSASNGTMRDTKVYVDAGDASNVHAVGVFKDCNWTFENCDFRMINEGGFAFFQEDGASSFLKDCILVTENTITARHYNGRLKMFGCVIYQGDGQANALDASFAGARNADVDLRGNLFITNGGVALNAPTSAGLKLYKNHYWELSSGTLATISGEEYADLADLQDAGYDVEAEGGAIPFFSYGTSDFTPTFAPWPYVGPRIKASKPQPYEQGRARRRRWES